jgi:hypothetical protein
VADFFADRPFAGCSVFALRRAGTTAVKLVLVVLDHEVVAGGNSVLKLLDERLFELDDVAALFAYQVVVVSIIIGQLVSSCIVTKI